MQNICVQYFYFYFELFWFVNITWRFLLVLRGLTVALCLWVRSSRAFRHWYFPFIGWTHFVIFVCFLCIIFKYLNGWFSLVVSNLKGPYVWVETSKTRRTTPYVCMARVYKLFKRSPGGYTPELQVRTNSTFRGHG